MNYPKHIFFFVNDNNKQYRFHMKEKISLQTLLQNIKHKSIFIDIRDENIKVLSEKDILENKELYIEESNKKKNKIKDTIHLFTEKDILEENKIADVKQYFALSAFQASPEASELPIPDDTFFE